MQQMRVSGLSLSPHFRFSGLRGIATPELAPPAAKRRGGRAILAKRRFGATSRGCVRVNAHPKVGPESAEISKILAKCGPKPAGLGPTPAEKGPKSPESGPQMWPPAELGQASANFGVGGIRTDVGRSWAVDQGWGGGVCLQTSPPAPDLDLRPSSRLCPRYLRHAPGWAGSTTSQPWSRPRRSQIHRPPGPRSQAQASCEKERQREGGASHARVCFGGAPAFHAHGTGPRFRKCARDILPPGHWSLGAGGVSNHRLGLNSAPAWRDETDPAKAQASEAPDILRFSGSPFKCRDREDPESSTGWSRPHDDTSCPRCAEQV